jgi:hypothetical protein
MLFQVLAHAGLLILGLSTVLFLESDEDTMR